MSMEIMFVFVIYECYFLVKEVKAKERPSKGDL